MRSAESLFRHQFGTPPEAIAFAPGRVNIIGEHTDYQNGLSMPGALRQGTTVALSSHAHSPGMITTAEAPEGWQRYVASALQEGSLDPAQCAVAVSSDLPIGAGLSSSAALIVATLLATQAITGQNIGRLEMAKAARRAEHRAVGVPCGLLDPVAILFGEQQRVLLLDFQDPGQPTPLQWPAECRLALFDSGVRHSLAHSAYTDRVETLRRVAGHYGAPDLRSAESFNPSEHSALDAKRAKHFFSECARVVEFAAALQQNDLASMGELLTESHRSLQFDYEVSCEEADLLIDHLIQLPDCLGARMVGGGFGGMILALFEGQDLPSQPAPLGVELGSAATVINTSLGPRKTSE